MLSNIRYILWLRDIHKWVFTTPWRTVNPQKSLTKYFRSVMCVLNLITFYSLNCVWTTTMMMIHSHLTHFKRKCRLCLYAYEQLFWRQKRLLYYLGECIFWIFWDDHDVGDLRSFSCWFYLWPHTVACSSFWPSLRQVHQFGLGLRKLETPWCELLGRRDWLSLHSYGNDGDVPYHPYTRTS